MRTARVFAYFCKGACTVDDHKRRHHIAIKSFEIRTELWYCSFAHQTHPGQMSLHCGCAHCGLPRILSRQITDPCLGSGRLSSISPAHSGRIQTRCLRSVGSAVQGGQGRSDCRTRRILPQVGQFVSQTPCRTRSVLSQSSRRLLRMNCTIHHRTR